MAVKISDGTPITPVGTEYVPLGTGSGKKIATTLDIGNLGLGNAFTKFTGPTTSTKTFTLPNASSVLLYDGISNATLVTPVLNGLPTGTGISSVATASTLASRDVNVNLSASNFLSGYTTTATVAGTTTLTVASTYFQYFTGSTTQTVVLPVTSTLILGQSFNLENSSSGVVTVNSSGSNLVITLAGNSKAIVTCILTSGTTAASWDVIYIPASPLIAVGDLLVGSTVVGGVATPSKISAGAVNLALIGNGAGVAPSYQTITSNMVAASSTNDAATAGYIGEVFDGIQSTYTNYTTTATYQNITSITLTAGDWEISATGTFSTNSATITSTANTIFVISTTTASATGSTEGRNIIYIPQSALVGTGTKESFSITPYRVSISGTTTYYLNTQSTFTLGNPQFVGSIHARRNR